MLKSFLMLTFMPISSCGLRLVDDAVRLGDWHLLSVTLRLAWL